MMWILITIEAKQICFDSEFQIWAQILNPYFFIEFASTFSVFYIITFYVRNLQLVFEIVSWGQNGFVLI